VEAREAGDLQRPAPGAQAPAKPPQALEYGLAAATIANDDQLKAYFGAQTLERYPRNWSETLAQFLINPIVRGVLLVIFVICLLVELAAPGVGVFGATAGLSLLIVIGAPWLAGMAQWWEILLIVVGLALIAVEMFVIPGFGVAGVGGAACVLVGLVGTFVSDDLSTPAGQSDLIAGVTATLTALLAAGIDPQGGGGRAPARRGRRRDGAAGGDRQRRAPAGDGIRGRGRDRPAAGGTCGLRRPAGGRQVRGRLYRSRYSGAGRLRGTIRHRG
jgi:hypothetical protein